MVEALLIMLIVSNNPRAQINRACAVFIFFLSIWSFFFGLINLAHTEEEATLFFNCAMVGLSSFPVAAIWFVLIFTRNERLIKNGAGIVATAMLPALIMYWQWSGNLIYRAVKTQWGWAMIWSQGLYSWAYVFYFYVLFAVCAYFLIRYFNVVKAFRQKKQSKLLIIFGCIAAFFGLITGVYYQVADTFAVPQLTDFAGLIWGIGIVYAVSRYGMMSIIPVVAPDEILGTMTESVLLLDENGKIRYANSANTSLLGIRGSKLKGIDFNSIVVDSKKADELLARSTVTGVRAQCEMSYLTRQGVAIPVLVSASAVNDSYDGVAGFVISATNISERKQVEEQLIRSNEKLKKSLNDAVNTMTKMVELRDPYTYGHQRRVTDLAVAMAKYMGIDADRIDILRMASNIHDIGKIYVPSEILSKPGKLGEIEFRMLQTHPQGGYDIAKSMDFHCSVADTVLQHHERLDGSGYPRGLKAAEILQEAKILAVADVVEAMASNRPYRPALGIDKALEEIRQNNGILYDCESVNACLQLFNQEDFKFE
ncbi:MAG: HD domain-containing phosphohydrolase [Dehalococcoidia bacterium]